MRAYDEQSGAYRWMATLPGGGGEAAVTDRIALEYGRWRNRRVRRHFGIPLVVAQPGVVGDEAVDRVRVVYAVQANAGADTRLYAFDVGTGATRWSAPIHGSTSSQPAIAGGVVFVGSGDGNVYGFDAQTGAQLWSAPSGAAD